MLGTVSFAYGFVTALSSELPQLDPTRSHPQRNGYVYASDGHTVLAVLRGSENRVLVASDRISPVMKQAIVAIEDRRFFEHRGVDIRAIVRAVWADLRNEKVVQGGSTITQQLVKNTYVKSHRSLARKLKEAALAWQLEQRWSKDRILTAYLNTIYFGNGAYGIEQAARVYFGHGASKLALPEAALLAGIPPDPALYDPVTNPSAARERRRTVLQAMLDERDITYNEFRLGNRTPLPRPQDVHLPGTQGPAQYFTNYVKQQLIDRYGTAKVFGGGLRVKTSIDLGLQQLARKAVARWLQSGSGPSAALVAVDPRDGRVVAMVGGENYRKSQFNLAVQGQRQPGSAFKPIVLATALQQGISPATRFVSKPVTIPLGDRVWSVRNYEGSNLGPIDLETATTYSDNTVYAQLTWLVEPVNVVRTAHRLGITSPLENYFAIGLGAEAVNPLEMARAFSAFANGGRRIDGSIFGNRPRSILAVNEHENRPLARQVLAPNNAALVTRLLENVVSQGTGRRAALPDRPTAGKTGTTENYGDAWFVGYTPQLVVAVWVGYPHELRPMLSEFRGDPVAGGTFPALIWKSFMERALPYLQDKPQRFPYPTYVPASPKSLVLRDGVWQLDNGNCRQLVEVVYFEGRAPARTANCRPNEVEVPSVIGLSYERAKARLAAQPLTPLVVYKPAAPGEAVGVVVRQIPARGRLSSFARVTLVFAKPIHGVVPRVVGLSVSEARRKLLRLGLRPALSGFGDRVVDQKPRWNLAASAGMRVTLYVSRQKCSALSAGRACTSLRS